MKWIHINNFISNHKENKIFIFLYKPNNNIYCIQFSLRFYYIIYFSLNLSKLSFIYRNYLKIIYLFYNLIITIFLNLIFPFLHFHLPNHKSCHHSRIYPLNIYIQTLLYYTANIYIYIYIYISTLWLLNCCHSLNFIYFEVSFFLWVLVL